MTVQELMGQVDSNRVADAYILLDYQFSKDNEEQTLVEKYERIPKLRHVIVENIREFQECKIDEAQAKHTLFVLEVASESYENSRKKELYGFVTRDEDILPVVDKDFRLFDDEGKARVNFYGFDMDHMNELAGYKVADSSIEVLGKDICAAYILSEIFFFGFMTEEREKNIDDFIDELEESAKQIDRGECKCSSYEDLCAEFEAECEKKLSEDELAYHKAKNHFEKEVEEIVDRHNRRVCDERHQLYIDTIRAEYKGRS